MSMLTIPFRSVESWARAASIVSAITLSVVCLLPSVTLAQTAKGFVGSWVEDQAKRTIGAMRSLTFRQAAGGSLEELRGSYANPLVQPVHFDGKPYSVDESRNTIAWKQIDATHFERTIAQNGQLLNTRRLQVSADGATLTEATENTEGGTKTLVTIVYRRTSGSGSGLAGVWKPQSYKSDTPNTLRMEAAGNGLRVATNERASNRVAYTLTFDGKVAPVDGPTTISGTAVAGKLVNDRAIEIAQSRSGVPTGRATWSLSQDGKALTVSTTNIGPDATKEPSVVVYIRR